MKRLREELLLEEIDTNRRESCQVYQDCLRYAAVHKFKSWTCRDCEPYGVAPIEIEISLYNNPIVYPYAREPIEELQQFLCDVTKGMEKVIREVRDGTYVWDVEEFNNWLSKQEGEEN